MKKEVPLLLINQIEYSKIRPTKTKNYVIRKKSQRRIFKVGSKRTGITSGRRDKVTGERETIYFISNWIFHSKL
jgi:hypothetical protein